jgi:hypothetical protein
VGVGGLKFRERDLSLGWGGGWELHMSIEHVLMDTCITNVKSSLLYLKVTMKWVSVYRNVDPPIWYDTNVKLFEIQRV